MPASHRTAEPAVYTCPSRQYVEAPPSRQAADADSLPARPGGRRVGRDQEERTGSVGALGVARGQAALGEQRGLLVDGDPGDRQRPPERRRLAREPRAVRYRRPRGRT